MVNIVLNFGGKMTPAQTFIAHIVVIVCVVGSAIALAVEGIIDGATAIGMIGVATGVTFGAVVTAQGSNTATTALANQAAASQPAPVTPAPAAVVAAPVVAAPVAAPPVGP